MEIKDYKDSAFHQKFDEIMGKLYATDDYIMVTELLTTSKSL